MTSSAPVTSVNDELFSTLVIGCPLPAVVVFEKSCWGTTHIMKPILEKVASDCINKIQVFKYDLEKSSVISKRYGIEDSIAILVFNSGELVYRTGVISNSELKKIVNPFINSPVNL